MVGNRAAREILRTVLTGGELSLEGLSVEQQTVFLVCASFDFVSWGGFDLLLYCDWPGANDFALLSAAYRRIDAERAADLLERMATLFPGSRPPSDYRTRRRYLQRIPGFQSPAGTLIGRLQDAFLDEHASVSAGLEGLVGSARKAVAERAGIRIRR